MQRIALLRGVTPNGKNRIPKMAYLAELLEKRGFQQVRTYIQSGNILLETEWPERETAKKIHQGIYEELGADLEVILKTKEQLAKAAAENPFDASLDASRIHLVFTNQPLAEIEAEKRKALTEAEFGRELLREGRECFYLYLPRDAAPKRLHTNYLEKRLGIRATMRKWSVIRRLAELAEE